MKAIILFSMLVWSAASFLAYSQAQEVAHVKSGEWLDHWEQAKKEATATERPILMLFTGSDWCPYCLILERKVLSRKSFQEFAGERLVLMMVDQPVRKELSEAVQKQNENLVDAYGVEFFPTLLVVDAGGAVKATVDYDGESAKEFVELLKEKL